MNFIKVKIKEILESPPTNSGLKKRDVFLIKKSEEFLPVYSASQDEEFIFGWVSKDSGWRTYNNVLTWNKDGSAGKVFYRKEVFVPYEKVKILKIKDKFKDLLDYDFLKFVIENKLMTLGFNFGYKASMERVLEVEIKIPINDKKEFDIDVQKRLAIIYDKISDFKKELKKLYKKITDVNVLIEENYKKKSIELLELFEIKKGSSKYTKSFIRNNKGEYPVYSSQTTGEGIIGYINSYDYDNKCLTWTTDGIYAGTIFYRNGKFSMTTHCGALIPKEEISSKIDLLFLFFQLKQILKDYAIGEGNKRVTAEIIENVIIEIPERNGSFDLEKQKEISNKFNIIEKIKEELRNKFKEIIHLSINFEDSIRI